MRSLLRPLRGFVNNHIGPNGRDVNSMLKTIDCKSLDHMVNKVVPENIRRMDRLKVGEGLSEHEALNTLKEISKKNVVRKSYIGMGYYGTILPPVIQRNVLENPAWYTPYTPYQAEISQGRLEGLLVFQTMVQDLTKMDISNASLLDEATAAGEAMNLAFSFHKEKRTKFWVSNMCHPQTIVTLQTRAEPLGIEIVVGDINNFKTDDEFFGALVQYPNTDGTIESIDKLESFVNTLKENKVLAVCATDLMALTLIKPPGEMGFDVAIGSSQRFGVPMGFGGPAAAFFATSEKNKRLIPGRIVGISKDTKGKRAIRLALQTREQHIKREKANSNICTSQNLLANVSAFYSIYHGQRGIMEIGKSIHHKACALHTSLRNMRLKVGNEPFFDTVKVTFSDESIAHNMFKHLGMFGIHVRNVGNSVMISIDETTEEKDIEDILKRINLWYDMIYDVKVDSMGLEKYLLSDHERESTYLDNPIFNSHNTETKLMRFLHQLQSKDISLVNSMIPLGSCTMKLNSAAEMMPVTWDTFSSLHPFTPSYRTKGYQQMIQELEDSLANITGFDAVSLQPNSGSQGEYTGLYMIQKYHESNGQDRDVCFVPMSSHGTNPASAKLCGMKVVSIKIDPDTGYIDMNDLKENCIKHKDKLSAIMITYPSVFGIFDDNVKSICDMIHEHGGQVYLDGANMNAQIGLTSPNDIGADVCHLNLHKTFCIPHGGGGPGMGPVCVKSHLKPYLPTHPIVDMNGTDKDTSIGTIAAAPWSSANILPIVWMYIKMMGSEGLEKASKVAILNANYMMTKLEPHYRIAYKGSNKLVAHEFIIDLSKYKKVGITEEDVAKRLIDYGFHSPTMSWPIVNSLMIEPTESEDKEELDRFVDSLISIKKEMDDVEDGKINADDSPLKHAPHTLEECTSEEWSKKYSREVAAFPLKHLKENKYWPPVGRVDNVYGDRNLFCSCD